MGKTLVSQSMTVLLCCAAVRDPDGMGSIPTINRTVTFNPGEFRMEISFVLMDDNIALEPQEMYTVMLSIETGMDILSMRCGCRVDCGLWKTKC